MLNPDILKRRFLSSPLVQFCTALLLSLLLSAASASAQTIILPIADAETSPILTAPFHVAGGVTITLDGSGSSDPDGDDVNLTYAGADDCSSGTGLPIDCDRRKQGG